MLTKLIDGSQYGRFGVMSCDLHSDGQCRQQLQSGRVGLRDSEPGAAEDEQAGRVDAGGAVQDGDAARRAAGQGRDAGEATRGRHCQGVGTAGSGALLLNNTINEAGDL